MRKLFTIALTLISVYCSAQQLKSGQLKKFNGASSSELMTVRFRKEATQIRKDATASWAYHLLFSFPNNPKTFHALQGYGILYLAVMNQDSSQFPVRRVYITNNKDVTNLREIGEEKVAVKDPAIKRVFGKNRVDYYYLIPYSQTQDTCELHLRWSNDDEHEVLLARFPNIQKLSFVKNGKFIETGDVDMKILKLFALQEFHIQL